MGGVECFPGGQAEFKGNTTANRQPVKIAIRIETVM